MLLMSPDRIALAREDVDRQVLSDAGEAVGSEEAGQRVPDLRRINAVRSLGQTEQEGTSRTSKERTPGFGDG